ncbi:MAG: YitT family protein [Chloroflexota bacterium]|nr:MAG: YitT family protein [Chloroflexota bacterium]
MVPGAFMNVARKSARSIVARISWPLARDYFFIALGALLQAIAMRLFLVPAHLVNGGISGLAQIINYYTGFPIGLMVFLGNLPLFWMGWRFLGGKRFALRTAFAVVIFALATDLLVYFLPEKGLTTDLVLNTLYGGLVSGVGFGLVYRGRGTSGGSDILARILNHWRGVSISQSYLLTDALIMFLAGLSFSWENALYALVMLYVSGIVAEAAMGGSDVVRTALIVTARPREVSEQILIGLERGVTMLTGRGAYTGAERIVLYCVVSRSEVNPLKALVHEADPKAFMVIGHAQEALGEGFRPLGGGV